MSKTRASTMSYVAVGSRAEVERLEEQEADVKTIRDLTALVRELNQLAKCDREDRTESLRVQWGEDTEQWSE